jgi:hypothetical protein
MACRITKKDVALGCTERWLSLEISLVHGRFDGLGRSIAAVGQRQGDAITESGGTKHLEA